MEPSQLGSLKGLIGTKDTRFILVRPLTVKVKAYDPVFSGIALVSITRERIHLTLALDCLLLALIHRQVVPLYTQADARRLIESRPAHKSVRLGLSTILALHYKLFIWRFIPLGLKPPLGLGPSIGLLHDPPSSSLSLQWYDPALLGGWLPLSLSFDSQYNGLLDIYLM